MKQYRFFLLLTILFNTLNNCLPTIFITPGYMGKVIVHSPDRMHWVYLQQALHQRGYNFEQTNAVRNLAPFHFLIQTEAISKGPLNYSKEKLILLIQEPPSVIAQNANKELHKKFSKILTWDDDLVDNISYFKLHYPQPGNLREIIEPAPFKDKKFCVLMNANKHSSHPHELYSERKRIIDFFENQESGIFDLYGNNWSTNLRNYRGKVKDKIACIREYKFCICYENIKNVRGYVTEKIFDCLRAGCLPIYWGASNITDYVSEDCFIDREKFKNNQELYDYLKNMPEEEYNQYIKNIHDYLQYDPRVDLFSIDYFVETFLHVLLET